MGLGQARETVTFVTARGAPAVAAGANGDEPHFRLLASQGEVARSFDIRGTLSIGSAPDNDIVFSGAGVASHHARIWLRDEKVMLHGSTGSSDFFRGRSSVAPVED